MERKHILLVSAAVALMAVELACGIAVPEPTATPESAGESESTGIPAGSLRSPAQEAMNMFRQYVEANYLKCGELYYLADTSYAKAMVARAEEEDLAIPEHVKNCCYLQFQGLDFGISESPLTQADRANGIEWQGTVRASCDIFRSCEGGWETCTGWQPCRHSTLVVPSQYTRYRAMRLIKKNGEWHWYEPANLTEISQPTPVPLNLTCEDVPK